MQLFFTRLLINIISWMSGEKTGSGNALLKDTRKKQVMDTELKDDAEPGVLITDEFIHVKGNKFLNGARGESWSNIHGRLMLNNFLYKQLPKLLFKLTVVFLLFKLLWRFGPGILKSVGN